MSAITPDTDEGITVSNEAGIQLVTIGAVGPATDTEPQGVFGMVVRNAVGEPEAYDGAVNVLAMIASGQVSAAFAAAPSTTTATAAVGPVAGMRSVHMVVAPDQGGDIHGGGASRYPGGTYRNTDAGGNTNYEAVGSYAWDAGTGLITITLTARSILTNPGTTAVLTYEVLVQESF